MKEIKQNDAMRNKSHKNILRFLFFMCGGRSVVWSVMASMEMMMMAAIGLGADVEMQLEPSVAFLTLYGSSGIFTAVAAAADPL